MSYRNKKTHQSKSLLLNTGNMSDCFPCTPGYQTQYGELVNALETAVHIHTRDGENSTVTHTPNNVTNKTQYVHQVILYLRPGVDGNEVNEVVQAALEQLNVTHLDKVTISLLQLDDVNFENSVRPIWRRLESLKDEKKVGNLGVYNFSQEQLQNLLKFAKHSPSVDYIPLKSLNEIKSEFINWAKEKNINLFSHGDSDQKTLFEQETITNLFNTYNVSDKEYKLSWAARYTSEIEDRKVITNFGYVFKCESESN